MSRKLATGMGQMALAGLLLVAGCSRSSREAAAAGAPVPEQSTGGVAPPDGAATGGATSPRVIPASGEEILRVVRQPGARAVLVNVWATWCVPCREEFPGLVRLRREYGPQGLRVVLVSGDFDSELAQVVQFLAEQGVDFPTYIKAGRDQEFINALSSRWTGALPATFIFDGRGALRAQWEAKASYETFEREVRKVLEETAAPAG